MTKKSKTPSPQRRTKSPTVKPNNQPEIQNQLISEKNSALVPKTKLTETIKIDLTGRIPDLNRLNPKNVNLDLDYWSPTEEGESRILSFIQIVEGDWLADQDDPEKLIQKDCAYFAALSEEGLQVVRNASKRLLSAARLMEEGEIYLITYLGKKKNRTNENHSSHFTIQPMELTQS